MSKPAKRTRRKLSPEHSDGAHAWRLRFYGAYCRECDIVAAIGVVRGLLGMSSYDEADAMLGDLIARHEKETAELVNCR